MTDKYVVFQKKEFDKFITSVIEGTRKEPIGDFYSQQIPDAVVIRRQDVFAPPALDAYANSIVAAVEILKAVDDQQTARRLLEISDYFHEQSSIAWMTERKLPD